MKSAHKYLFLLVVPCLLALYCLFIFLPDTSDKKAVLQNIGPEHLSGPFKIQVAISPEQPRVGKNQLKLIIRDNNDQAVANADIQAVAEMPAMGSMPTMYVPVDISSDQPGVYQGQFELPMMGAWPLTLKIDAGSQGQAQLSFDM
ncbi:MAG: hypothetical protein GQ532_15555, partial [Methylomarinum sp.]|nr:hypothetical protein [Methylomarinum sp.]